MSEILTSPELLMPAGNLEKLETAYSYGADAAYIGVPLFSLRARDNEFGLEQLAQGIQSAHALGKKIYVTANIFARNLKLKPFREQISAIANLKPDAMIMSDPGLMAIVRELHPEIPIHLSVQANCMNWMSVKFWQSMGVERVILSRELRLSEIKEIRQRVPDIELEAFVHGSICIAYSGRCLMSQYMSYRDANQGVCDNSCRYPVGVYETKAREGHEYYVQDFRDPESFYRIDEDENGTFLMNAKDLCLIEHLKELKEAGVCSFKVEGRTKSSFYVAMVARAYRQAIDDMMAAKPFRAELLQDLELMASRGYHKGFFNGAPGPEGQEYQKKDRTQESSVCGRVVEKVDDLKFKMDARGRIGVGEHVEVITPSSRYWTEVVELRDRDGKTREKLHPGMGLCSVVLKETAPVGSFICRQGGHASADNSKGALEAPGNP